MSSSAHKRTLCLEGDQEVDGHNFVGLNASPEVYTLHNTVPVMEGD